MNSFIPEQSKNSNISGLNEHLMREDPIKEVIEGINDVVNGKIITNSHTGDLGGNLKITSTGQVVADSSDWTGLNPSFFGYNNSTRTEGEGLNYAITCDGIDSRRFQAGDKVKLVQGGVTKYFYVRGVDSAEQLVGLFPNDDYTFTSDPIQYLAYSRLGSPEGFPNRFEFTPRLFYSTGGTDYLVTATTNNLNFYYMIGSTLFYTVQMHTISLGHTVSLVFVDMSFVTYVAGTLAIVGGGYSQALVLQTTRQLATVAEVGGINLISNEFTGFDLSKDTNFAITTDLQFRLQSSANVISF